MINNWINWRYWPTSCPRISSFYNFFRVRLMQGRVPSLVSSLQSLPQRHSTSQRMKNHHLFTAAPCAAKTFPTPPNFNATYAPTQERGPSPAQCARRDFQRRGCSWSTKGSTRGRSRSHALSAWNDLLVRASSGSTGGRTPARGRITAPSVWRASLVTGTWKHTWRRCTRRLSPASRGRSSRVRTAIRAVTQRPSWEIIRGLTLERGPTSALSVTNVLPCPVLWWDMSVSTPALHRTTALTVGRHSRSSGRWQHTCGRTQEKNLTAAHSATSLL